MNPIVEIMIEDEYDGFSIRLRFEDGDVERHRFDQEDDMKGLKDVFAHFCDNVTYEEAC